MRENRRISHGIPDSDSSISLRKCNEKPAGNSRIYVVPLALHAGPPVVFDCIVVNIRK